MIIKNQPMRLNEVRQIGVHRVRCGDMLDGLNDVMLGDMADVIYSDPPWGGGNLKYWATMFKKDGGSGYAPPSLAVFLRGLFTICKAYAKGPVLLEYGVRWEQELIAAGIEAGLSYYGKGNCLYGSPKRPLLLHLFSARALNVPRDYFQRIEGTTGLKTVLTAVEPFAVRGGVLLDMACGLGYSARAALAYEMRFIGNELNPKRLASTMRLLE